MSVGHQYPGTSLQSFKLKQTSLKQTLIGRRKVHEIQTDSSNLCKNAGNMGHW
ncbi:hypothetical protein Hdeb2414_s0015g00451721 [Helianthus debilis subsp. tardiflorus]